MDSVLFVLWKLVKEGCLGDLVRFKVYLQKVSVNKHCILTRCSHDAVYGDAVQQSVGFVCARSSVTVSSQVCVRKSGTKK